MKTCPGCGELFELALGQIASRVYCSDLCRNRRRDSQPYGAKSADCAGCEKRIWLGTGSKPPGEAMCNPCRKMRTHIAAALETALEQPDWVAANRTMILTRAHSKRTPCVDCGVPSWGVRCRPCRHAEVRAAARGRDVQKRLELNRRRQARLRSAPGLSQWARRALLAKWRRQGRMCSYCSAVVASVDHVIPVALGGTNYEGNLAPACLSCNLRKSDDLLIVWKRKLQSAAAA